MRGSGITETRRTRRRRHLGHRAATALQAVAIVAVYVCILAALMYPVANAAGYVF